jgi:hypothetical protein
MAYTPKDWRDAPDTSTPITAAALEDMETRLAAYSDSSRTVPAVTAPAHLRRWAAAVSEATFTPAVINLVGDELTVGVGSDGNAAASLPGSDPTYRSTGLAGQLRTLFGQDYYGVTGDGIWNVTDSRVSLAGGAVADTASGPNHGAVKLAAAGQSVTYSLPACPDFEIWLWDGGTGTITFTVDGGAPTSLPAGSGGTAATWSRVTVTGQASTTHSLVIAGAAGATAYVAGVQPASQDPGVRVNRMGRVGDTTANLVGLDSALNADAAGQARQQAAYAKVGGPHLVVVGYGVNDYAGQNATSSSLAQPGTTPAQYQANLQAFCNVAVASGVCVLIWCGLPTPSAPTPQAYQRSAYVTAARSVAAATDHVAAVDVADVTKDWPTASGLGLQTQVSTNPTRRGHGLLARILRDVTMQQVAFG